MSSRRAAGSGQEAALQACSYSQVGKQRSARGRRVQGAKTAGSFEGGGPSGRCPSVIVNAISIDRNSVDSAAGRGSRAPSQAGGVVQGGVALGCRRRAGAASSAAAASVRNWIDTTGGFGGRPVESPRGACSARTGVPTSPSPRSRSTVALISIRNGGIGQAGARRRRDRRMKTGPRGSGQRPGLAEDDPRFDDRRRQRRVSSPNRKAALC